MVSRNTTLVPSLGLPLGQPVRQASALASEWSVCHPERERKKERTFYHTTVKCRQILVFIKCWKLTRIMSISPCAEMLSRSRSLSEVCIKKTSKCCNWKVQNFRDISEDFLACKAKTWSDKMKAKTKTQELKTNVLITWSTTTKMAFTPHIVDCLTITRCTPALAL